MSYYTHRIFNYDFNHWWCPDNCWCRTWRRKPTTDLEDAGDYYGDSKQIKLIEHIGNKEYTDDDVLKRDIDVVITTMISYKDSLKIQRACCHTLSNIAMQEQWSKYLTLKLYAHLLVRDTVKKFYKSDWKICWLGCSALWNLSRNTDCRSIFPISMVGLLFDILKLYHHEERVVNTAIGTLSNLSLNPKFKQNIGGSKDLDILLQIICNFSNVTQVASTSAGLLANLAVNDNIADKLMDMGVAYILKMMLKHNRKCTNTTFYRNTIAALSNVSTSDKYEQECMRYQLIEELYYVKNHTDNMAVAALLFNCLTGLQLSLDSETTSYHYAARLGCTDVLQGMIDDPSLLWARENITEIDIFKYDYADQELYFDFNKIDNKNYSLLDYAIDGKNDKLMEYLLKCGTKLNNYKYDHLPHKCQISISQIVNDKEMSRNKYIVALHDVVPFSISKLIISYLSSYNIYKTEEKHQQINQKFSINDKYTYTSSYNNI